jgi:drug/metabolite transporter (DMT)-like permease
VALSNAAKADLYLVVVTLLAAISWIFSREAVLLMPPLLFMSLRFLLAGILLGAIGYRELSQLSTEACLRATKVGLVFGAGMSCWVMGLFLGTHVGEGAFLTSLGVVLVPIISRVVFGEHQPRSIWYALPVATAGLALLSLKNGFRPEVGQIFYIVAAAIFALYYTLNTHAATTRHVRIGNGELQHREKIPALPLTAIVLTTVGAAHHVAIASTRALAAHIYAFHCRNGRLDSRQRGTRQCRPLSTANPCSKPVHTFTWRSHSGHRAGLGCPTGRRLVW